MEERKAIFKVHTKPLKLAESVDTDFLAKQTPGFSGADIANVCNEAALIAAVPIKKKLKNKTSLMLLTGLLEVWKRKAKSFLPPEKKVIAFHEAGHAAVSWMTEFANPLLKVTIVPRGKSLGAAWYFLKKDKLLPLNKCLTNLLHYLGGRASEEVNFGKVSTGALNDLERVTKQAYNMIVFFGLNDKIGNISYYDSTGQQEYNFHKPYSEKTAQLIDQEVSALVEKAYKRSVSHC